MAHQSDGLALSLGCLGTGTEQCTVSESVSEQCAVISVLLDVLELEAVVESRVGSPPLAAELCLRTERPQGASKGRRGGEGGWLARHGTSIRWASLLAWMFGHVHRAMCGGGCQFEVLEEHVRA